MSPARIQQFAREQFQILRESRFVRDRLFVGCAIASVVLIIAMWGLLIIRVHPTDFPVPVHYTTLGGFDALGPWYQPYQAGIFSTLLVVANLVLAYLSYHRSRIGSLFLLSGGVVIALFSLIIANAFSGVV